MENVINNAKKLLKSEKDISPSFRICLEVLFELLWTLINRLWTNSKNSSKSPSQDQNREKTSKTNTEWKKPWWQKWRIWKNLRKVENPDNIIKIKIKDEDLLWNRSEYANAWYSSKQEFDIDINLTVTEFRAERLRHKETWKIITAEYPDKIKNNTQYWNSIKSHSVYLSQYQLLPYEWSSLWCRFRSRLL